MEQLALILKYKHKIINIAIIIVTLIIVSAIYKSQAKGIQLLVAKRDSELKKDKILTEISQTEKKINEYKKFFSSKDVSLVINAISNIAADTNIRIITVKPKPEEDRPGYIKYSFDLVINTNSYHTIGKFISRIENNSDYIFFIEGAVIKPVEAEEAPSGQKNKLFANLIINTVMFKD